MEVGSERGASTHGTAGWVGLSADFNGNGEEKISLPTEPATSDRRRLGNRYNDNAIPAPRAFLGTDNMEAPRNGAFH